MQKLISENLLTDQLVPEKPVPEIVVTFFSHKTKYEISRSRIQVMLG